MKIFSAKFFSSARDVLYFISSIIVAKPQAHRFSDSTMHDKHQTVYALSKFWITKQIDLSWQTWILHAVKSDCVARQFPELQTKQGNKKSLENYGFVLDFWGNAVITDYQYI